MAVAPGLVQEKPLSQAVHSSTDPEEYEPASHSLGALAPRAHEWPEGQAVQLPEPMDTENISESTPIHIIFNNTGR